MKKYLIVLLPAFLFLIACDKDETEDGPTELVVVQEQVGFAINYTATWCGPCGDWGAPLIHDFADAGNGNVVAITAHASGDPMYNNSLYSSFNSDRPDGGGIPSFWVGDKSTTKMSDMNELLSRNPIAGVALNYSVEGSTMTVNTRTQFFSTVSGIYHLSVLLLESGIDGSSSAGDYEQNGTAYPESYAHDFVLRASSVEGLAYGEKIVVDPSKGDVLDKQVSFTINANWTNSLYPVAIIWKKNSLGEPVFEFINATK